MLNSGCQAFIDSSCPLSHLIVSDIHGFFEDSVIFELRLIYRLYVTSIKISDSFVKNEKNHSKTIWYFKAHHEASTILERKTNLVPLVFLIQNLLQNHSNTNSMVLAKIQKCLNENFLGISAHKECQMVFGQCQMMETFNVGRKVFQQMSLRKQI